MFFFHVCIVDIHYKNGRFIIRAWARAAGRRALILCFRRSAESLRCIEVRRRSPKSHVALSIDVGAEPLPKLVVGDALLALL